MSSLLLILGAYRDLGPFSPFGWHLSSGTEVIARRAATDEGTESRSWPFSSSNSFLVLTMASLVFLAPPLRVRVGITTGRDGEDVVEADNQAGLPLPEGLSFLFDGAGDCSLTAIAVPFFSFIFACRGF